MIKAVHLTKEYGRKTAVKDLNFSIKQGEIVGFLGPNGAGKSTTLNMLAGTLRPTSGDIFIQGHSMAEEPRPARAAVGYLPETPPLYPEMKVKEYLTYICRLKKVREPLDRHIASVCDMVKLTSVTDRVIRNLSKGYRQRVGMAQALIGSPDILILDEPTSGMDPRQMVEVRNLLLSLKGRHTVLLSSHVLSEIEPVCGRLLIIRNGEIAADDTPANLSHTLNQKRLFLRFDGNINQVIARLASLKGIRRIHTLGKQEKDSFDIELELCSDVDIRRTVFRYMAELDAPILAMRYRELTLEELFMKVTN